MLQMRQWGLNLSLRSMFSSSRLAAMSSCEAQLDRSVYVCGGNPAAQLHTCCLFKLTPKGVVDPSESSQLY